MDVLCSEAFQKAEIVIPNNYCLSNYCLLLLATRMATVVGVASRDGGQDEGFGADFWVSLCTACALLVPMLSGTLLSTSREGLRSPEFARNFNFWFTSIDTLLSRFSVIKCL